MTANCMFCLLINRRYAIIILSYLRGIRMKTYLKTYLKYCLFAVIFVCLFAALFLLPRGVSASADEPEDNPPAAVAASVDDVDYASIDEALSAWKDGTSLVLRADVTYQNRVTTTGEKTLDLNGFTFTGTGSRTLQVDGTLYLTDTSAQKNGMVSGKGVWVSGSLYMKSGSIAYNDAELGAGVYVDEGGSFSMSGGSVKNNVAGRNGGGIYVGGALSLSGDATVSENTDDSGNANNIYLPSGKTVTLTSYKGSAGVSAYALGPVAVGDGVRSALTADNLSYTVDYADGTYMLAISPLAQITAEYRSDDSVYPTTELTVIKEDLALTVINENGAKYAGEYTTELTGNLLPGESEVTVTATGQGGESVQTTVLIEVATPLLTKIAAVYKQDATLYYDSGLDAVKSGLTVTGTYSDGFQRKIYSTAEETAAQGEDYIVDYYTLSGSLAEHENGVAEITVTVGGYSRKVTVAVSKYVIDVSEIEVIDVTIVRQSGAWNLSFYAFTPSVPEGIEPVVTLNGETLSANALSAGVYTVTISFIVTDEENYEEVEGTLSATLTVNSASVTGTVEGSALTYEITADGGIPPTWKFSVAAVTASAELDGMDVVQAFEITLRDDGYIVTKPDRTITLRILASDALNGKEAEIYRVLSDGSVQKVSYTTDGDYFVVQVESAAQDIYLIAVDSGYGVYLALTIVFGVLCVAGAGLLIWYFKARRKMKLK